MNFANDGLERKIALLFIAVSLLLALGLAAGVALKHGAPMGSDFYYHLEYAKKYASGQIAMFDPTLTESNKGPYPPLFHLLLAIPAFFGLGVQFGALLQALFYPLALGATAYAVFKLLGVKQAAFTSVILLGAVAFFDRAGQVTPQAFDAILAPIAILAFFQGREKLFLAAVFLMAYSHAPFSLLVLAPFVAYALLVKGSNGSEATGKTRENAPLGKKSVLKAVALALPIVLLISLYLPAYLSAASIVNNRQEEMISKDPIFLVTYIGSPLFFLFFTSLLADFWEKRKARKKGGQAEAEQTQQTSLDKSLSFFCLLWFACTMPLLLFFPDRFASYAAQPMAVYAALFYARKNTSVKKMALDLAFLLVLAIGYNLYDFYTRLFKGQLKPVP